MLQIFKEFIEPILDTLHALLEPGKQPRFAFFALTYPNQGITRDEIWRNDFCRYKFTLLEGPPERLNSVVDI